MLPKYLPKYLPKSLLANVKSLPAAGSGSARRLNTWLVCLAMMVTGGIIALEATSEGNLSPASANAINEDAMDRSLQRAATIALGEKSGTIIVMDPQTGRVRAVVNPKLAFEENLPPGSTIKPFTALAAFRSGLIDDDSRTACREEYVHDNFHTTCSHPRDLPPLNSTDAIAYSCNYYFGRLGERMNEPAFVSALSEFGFGRRTGINADNESQGKLLRNGWRAQNAIGESDNVLATPIQIITAYSALVNGGHLLTPRIASANAFIANHQSNLIIDTHQRLTIVKGMRGAVRYGTAETAGLYKLPGYVFGKTGTATQLNGFRSQGWFIGFASSPDDGSQEDSQPAPEQVRLAVLVFLTKAHGSDAAEVARPVFDEFAKASAPLTSPTTGSVKYSQATLKDSVRIHLVNDGVTQTIPLEDYVRRVVATEGSTENQLEALKALAVAARTYAARNMGRHKQDGYDFCSTTHCQRYQPADSQSGSGSALVTEAVEATRGEMIQDSSGQVADSYFSASCGGASANIGTLWGGATPNYLRGVRDESCDTEPHHSWTDVISETQLSKALQSDPRTNVGRHLTGVAITRRDSSGRAELLTIEGNRKATIKGWEFKIIVGRALGWNILKSSKFEVARSGSNFIFRGKGFGHGLGLCQEGAHVMASQGSNYRQILEKYFPTTRVGNEAGPRGSADLLWTARVASSGSLGHLSSRVSRGRQTLRSETVTINYPAKTEQSEIEKLLRLLQLSQQSLVNRVAAAGMRLRLPPIEVFINETTGDFVGRTGQPPWAAAATRSNRIELQPLQTLKARGILETTVKHELVHIIVDAVGGGRAPRWLAEGLAINYAGEGPLVSRYHARQRLTIQEIEQQLESARSANDMRAAYAAAYSEVRRLIRDEGEASVWRRVVR